MLEAIERAGWKYIEKTGMTPNAIIVTRKTLNALRLEAMERLGHLLVPQTYELDEYMGMKLVVVDEEPIVAYLPED